MCGICGVLNLTVSDRTDIHLIQQMLEMTRHRGPDGFGIYSDQNIVIGNARLSIIDLFTGDQPIGNENGTLWIIQNGEIFNYIELRNDLERKGHLFITNSDTETILHAYEEYSEGCLERLNGQFSFAIWDNVNRSLFIARDRLGITPLFYSVHNGKLIFGSEIKAILAYPGISAIIDPIALKQAFTYWSVLSPRTIFQGINELPPGHYLTVKEGKVSVEEYWSIDFINPISPLAENEYLDEFEYLLRDATCLRLRSDVPVGIYLSGGIDSSTITSIACQLSNQTPDTFSISFSDPRFDENQSQLDAANYFGTNHHVIRCNYEAIGKIFPEVIWHTETPILRTAPAPMILLSKLVNEYGYKVVLTGEGADEFLSGYDIFKEMIIRRFWAKNPESKIRPLLFKRLYQDIEDLYTQPIEYLKSFYKKGLLETDSPYYSHFIRWNNTGRITRFLIDTEKHIDYQVASLPTKFNSWTNLAKAQYLEITTFFSSYLLSSQSDRMAMANSVEGRHPYLDYRLIDFYNQLPDNEKINGLQEKWLLRRLGVKLLPENIYKKKKKPFRAPIHQCFFSGSLDYVHDLLSKRAIEENGLLNPIHVQGLVTKASKAEVLGEVDSMAIAGIISLQLLDHLFIKNLQIPRISSSVIKYIER